MTLAPRESTVEPARRDGCRFPEGLVPEALDLTDIALPTTLAKSGAIDET